jgi:hypothetical protein
MGEDIFQEAVSHSQATERGADDDNGVGRHGVDHEFPANKGSVTLRSRGGG